MDDAILLKLEIIPKSASSSFKNLEKNIKENIVPKTQKLYVYITLNNFFLTSYMNYKIKC